jgi:hypothetical protein
MVGVCVSVGALPVEVAVGGRGVIVKVRAIVGECVVGKLAAEVGVWMVLSSSVGSQIGVGQAGVDGIVQPAIGRATSMAWMMLRQCMP